jgi:hypothetical protein
MKFTFKKLPDQYAIAKFKNPQKVNLSFLQTASFFLAIRTEDEFSILCEESFIDEKNMITDSGWIGFRVVGTMELTLTGITATISGILAEAKINMLTEATYDTDYFFVPKEKFALAKKVLEAAGNEFV